MALRKILYGVLFVALLPALLVLWARGTASIVALPVTFPPAVGWVAAALGAALMLWGMGALWFVGRGLPMNAYPPPVLVTRGVYRYLSHPIYVGACTLAAGCAIVFRSGSGFWLVSPVLMLGCTALVFGYEREDLRARFGALPRPLIGLPAEGVGRPTWMDRVSCYLLVLAPHLFLYVAFIGLGTPPDGITACLPFEQHLPIIEWTELFYVSEYPIMFLVPLVAASRSDLRRFCVRGLLCMALTFTCFIAMPFVVPPRPFTPEGILGAMVVLERAKDTAAESFPSFHVIWAVLSAEVFVGRWPRLKWFWRGFALMIAVSCVTTGAHATVDVVAGFAEVALVANAGRVWQSLRRGAEKVANSWREWQWGSVRLINHGTYAGLGSFVALVIVGALVGQGHDAAILISAVSGLVGAGLWAQFIEGSPRLLRPFGYYGGLLGVILGSLAAPLVGTDAWLLLAAYAVAGPWVQCFGRLRCLVQGCCHGRPAPEEVGIRYTHPRSRVCRLSEWAGVPLHPTPLYSILWNVIVAVVTIRLWSLHAPLTFIAGMYLILTGLGRFVEESYRGEPQTPIFGRLRLYQWAAVSTVVAGAVVTTLGGAGAPLADWRWSVLLPAAAFGLLINLALGLDFPESDRRFARLV